MTFSTNPVPSDQWNVFALFGLRTLHHPNSCRPKPFPLWHNRMSPFPPDYWSPKPFPSFPPTFVFSGDFLLHSPSGFCGVNLPTLAPFWGFPFDYSLVFLLPVPTFFLPSSITSAPIPMIIPAFFRVFFLLGQSFFPFFPPSYFGCLLRFRVPARSFEATLLSMTFPPFVPSVMIPLQHSFLFPPWDPKVRFNFSSRYRSFSLFSTSFPPLNATYP